jgi:transporter family protein
MPKWLWLALSCMLCWGVWGYLVKLGTADMNPQAMQVLFVLGMIPPVIAALLRTGFKVQTDRKGVSYGILNGILATVGMVAFYAAMGRGKASLVGPLTALFPLFTVAGAMLLLKEKLNRVQALGIVVALAAVAIFAR